MSLTPHRLDTVVRGLIDVPGIVGVALGGSRATGTHKESSDYDLGLYYDDAFDAAALAHLRRLASEVSGPTAELTEPGGWGPWVDGGGWLKIDGSAVDWLYRNAPRVATSVESARTGRTSRHTQLGHPFGIPDHHYAAEVATSVILADPHGHLARWKAELTPYPTALADAQVRGLFAADFLPTIARKAVARRDTAYVAACLTEAVWVVASALCGAAGVWVTNEKGLVAAAARTPLAPHQFAERTATALGHLGTDSASLTAAIAEVEAVVAEARTALAAR
ncbi:nucleotidyltransferase domain-containing protein [Pyxidicoccus sp. 3LG]